MYASRLALNAFLLLVSGLLVSSARAEGPTKDLLGLNDGVGKRLTVNGGSGEQVSAAASQDAAAPGLAIAIKPGKADYPGVSLRPEGKAWDLSAFGHVEARVVNTGAKAARFALRVDNEGDWHDAPWNTEHIDLKPGERGTVTVIFGYQYGHHPGFALDPKRVVNILMMTDKTDTPMSLRVESLAAGGPAGEKPPVDPASIRVKPKDGTLVGLGLKIDAKTQIEASGAKATVEPDGQSVSVVLPADKGESSVTIKPPEGRWDLTLATEVRVRLKNTGAGPVTPSVQVTSNRGPTDLVTAAPLAAGEEKEIVVSFIPAVPGRGEPASRPASPGNKPPPAYAFTSDAASAVRITARHDGEAALLLESITAAAPPAALPDWLGKRPPVEGDWVKTLDEGFDGPAIDLKRWNIYGPNYWDKATHWTKDDLLLEGGTAKLRFERKRGFHNDSSDPNAPLQNLTGKRESDYACGYLDSWNKFTQRYGYFEARVKLPRVPGLWPTFWMVSGRDGEKQCGGDTGNGGMEMDIMEHLTRWGPYRYNIALHRDGYGKDHKAIGSDCIYVQADKDGFITPGLLWTPGVMVFYCNGKELWRWEDSRVCTVQAYFIIEVTTGGWDNNAVDDKQLPADYLLDYVRVWQRQDLASKAGTVPAKETEGK